MPKKTIIVGNGLSLAHDHEHFLLPNAIQHVWHTPGILLDDEKRCILQCLERDDGNPPVGEHELDRLHLVVTACGFLADVENEEIPWLSHYGRDFPATISKFIHKVATHLHLYQRDLPDGFVVPLCEFIRESKSHIATLNYDRLLYDAICSYGLVNGYDGDLIDGMLNAGYQRENMKRNPGRRLGYYLHLHGSPLFYGENLPKKLGRYELGMDTNCNRAHIVLTHIDHKMSVIESSKVLSGYWEFLGEALSESEEIILIGYGGLDEHLNQRVLSTSKQKRIRVVEWTDSGDFGVRLRCWQRKLGDSVDLIQLDNILEFCDW
ncbi:hypothetical protein AB4876_05575 [Zhongshania guokunii]|uniref:SIR2-like domain-containing protein n=1 Tax=Zhongshania guokunii TaxID=641783 RepID=A0ABV3U3A1_9GAMM